ncbi:MAG: beta-ketoacyl-ACP synthase 3, partial [Flavobacteriales bacterium]|nr:beta-ketoacyl-ACP synthase 3 [Flavobacteriales bacterium]
MTRIRAAITAVNGWVPPDLLTNADLEKMVDTNDEWIRSRTGIRERHILKGEGKGSSVLGTEAVRGLLTKRGIGPDEVDLVICATVTADHLFPATANIISDNLGIKNAWSFDINAACCGFLYSLVTASQFVETGKYKKVVVVGADKMSSIVDYTDRTTCVLFGDGAGAVLLEPTTEEFGVMDSILHTDGSGLKYLHQKAGGSAYPPTHETV